jgi:malonate decarboxylase alpha subunit
VAQVNEIVDKVPRVDIPGDQVDFIIKADRPFYVEPLFTRDPASVTESQILMAMIGAQGGLSPRQQSTGRWCRRYLGLIDLQAADIADT